jgi:hypothetical protein
MKGKKQKASREAKGASWLRLGACAAAVMLLLVAIGTGVLARGREAHDSRAEVVRGSVERGKSELSSIGGRRFQPHKSTRRRGLIGSSVPDHIASSSSSLNSDRGVQSSAARPGDASAHSSNSLHSESLPHYPDTSATHPDSLTAAHYNSQGASTTRFSTTRMSDFTGASWDHSADVSKAQSSSTGSSPTHHSNQDFSTFQAQQNSVNSDLQQMPQDRSQSSRDQELHTKASRIAGRSFPGQYPATGTHSQSTVSETTDQVTTDAVQSATADKAHISDNQYLRTSYSKESAERGASSAQHGIEDIRSGSHGDESRGKPLSKSFAGLPVLLTYGTSSMSDFFEVRMTTIRCRSAASKQQRNRGNEGCRIAELAPKRERGRHSIRGSFGWGVRQRNCGNVQYAQPSLQTL